ncbi:MAG TPA: hypothetical protein VI434_12735 [Candidatus Dormibacteraeota bacterium]
MTRAPSTDASARATRSQDAGVLTTLVPRIAAATIVILIAGTVVTDNSETGDFNKALYLGVLAVALVITVLFVRQRASTAVDMPLAVLASIGVIWGAWAIERPPLLITDWEGFGYRVALAAVALLFLLVTVLHPHRFTWPIRAALWAVAAVCCACDALGFIRTIDYMPAVNNNLNLLNDMLGPVAGKAPDSTFISQYSALYGWLFLPFRHVVSPLRLVAAMSIFITLLNIVTVGLAVVIIRRLFKANGILLALLLVVPITYVTSHLAGDQSSIASLFQELPVRVLSGLIVIAIGLQDLVLVYRGAMRTTRLLLVGVLCGIIAWNSQDFGLAAAGVYGLIVLFGATRSTRLRAFATWFGGLLLGVASYPLLLFAVGSPLDLGFVGAYVKLFGSGLGSAAIQIPGPVLVVVPIIISSTAVGWAMLRTRRSAATRDDARLDRAALTLTFVGTWSAACLVYYINRAFAAGQLQTMLLPCGICVAALLSVMTSTGELDDLFQPKAAMMYRWPDKVKMLPTGLFACMCFASVLLTPDPIVAARTLAHPPPMSGYTTYDLPGVLSSVAIAQRYTSGRPGGLTYLGESFNYISLATGVPTNAVLFPFPLPAISSVTDIECQYLLHHHSTWMVLSVNAVTAFGPNACAMYHAVDVAGLIHGQLQELR